MLTAQSAETTMIDGVQDDDDDDDAEEVED